MASRWRCPPETFVPPWVMGASNPPSISSTKSLPWAIVERAPQRLVGRVGVAVAQVARDRPAEQERLLGDERDPAPEVLAGHRADVDPIHQDRALGSVVQPRDRLMSVDLPEPVLPTMAVVCPAAPRS